MLKRIIPFTFSLFVTISLMAQVPRIVRTESPVGRTTLAGKRAPCTGQTAGTISLGPIINGGMSNSIPAVGNVTYLCFGDAFDLTHNGDFTFANPTTNPGVGYAFYNFDCIPSVDGPDIATVLGDCLFGNPNRAEELLIFVDLNDPASGNATFQNIVNPELGQSLPDFFNNGDPIQFWFAPITYDNLDNDTVKYEGAPVSGPCVSVSVDQAFSVVYLNPIEVINENFPFGGNACEARLTLKGGLPEFDPTENYNIIVRNVADPTILGEVADGPFGNRDLPVIKVSEAGIYDIIISDGKSCEVVHRIDMGACVSKDITFETVGGTFSLGSEVCIDITVKDFTDIVSFFFSLNWDTTFLTFERLDFTNGFLKGSDVNIINDPLGFASVLFQDSGFNGNTLPDDSTLFTICFIAQKEGDTDVNFTNAPGFPGNGAPIEVLTTDIAGNIGEVNLVPTEGTITIVDPNRLNTSITTIKDACPGDNNGSFDISVVGGDAPYEIIISWDFNGGGTDGPLPLANEGDIGTFSNLQPGKYEIFAKEVGPINPRFSRDSIEIVEANIAVNATTISSPVCNDDDNGVMNAEVALDGVVLTNLDDYTFIWVNTSGDTISMQQTANNLASGSYTVTAMNNNNCSFSDIGNLTQPARMTANLSDVSPTCSGVEDGSLQINNVDGGTMPYDFNWSNGVNDATNPNIASGKYIYTITDDGGCEVIDSINLMAETEIIIDNPIISSVQCFGFDNGSINVSSGLGGLQPSPGGNFVFTWSNNATDVNSTTNTSFADNLGPDTYTVILTHTNLPGCEATQDFTITEPDSLKIEIDNIVNVSSCPLSDGAATLRVEGGTIATDYSYIWEDGQILVTATNLAADTFKVIVTDDNACIDSLDVIVGTPPPPVIQFFEDDSVSCASDEGFLSVNAVRGDAPIPTNGYTWSHDPFITTSIAGALAPGIYFVTVTDDDQCSTIDSAIVFSPPALNIDTAIFVNPCFEAEDGRISVSISGGTPNVTGQPYTFLWPNGVTGSVLPNVAAGTYNLSITDANNCELVTPLVLNNLSRIMVAFDPASITGVDCFDNMDPADCDGAATATATYEDGTIGIFDFTWATGEFVSGTDQTASSSLCAGMQALIVTDGQCQITDSVNIPSPTQLLYDPINSSIDPVTCFGDPDGAATIAATGGTPGYTFDWPGGITGATVTAFASGNYTITITDANNCIRTHDIEISEPEELIANIDFDNTNDVICAGDNNGRIEVIVTGGNQGNKNYLWTDNVSNGSSAAGLSPGLYSIDVTDVNGCTGNTQYTVVEPPALIANVDFTPIQCAGFQTVISINSLQGGNGPSYTFSVDNSPAQSIDVVIPVFGGDHLISIFDARGCKVDNNLTIPEPDPVVVDFPENIIEIDLGGDIILMPIISSSLPIADLQWSTGGAAVDSTFICNSILCDNPTVNPLDNTSYTLLATDQNGCFAEGTILIEVDKNRNVYIPNVFAPNGTGFDTNDRFQIFTGSGVQRINFARVFNRWGTMVADLETLDPNNAGITIWDGLIKGQKANQGVYIYIIEVEFIDKQSDGSNTKLLYRGDITLLR